MYILIVTTLSLFTPDFTILSFLSPTFSGHSRPVVAEEDAEAVVADVATSADAPEYDKSLSSLIYIPTLKSKLVGTAEAAKKVTRASFSEPQFDELAEKDPLVLTK